MTYLKGGWVDESVPDLTEQLKGLDIDYVEFMQWLGVLLGRYRFYQKHKYPNAKTETAELDRYITSLEKVIQYHSPGELPPAICTEHDQQVLDYGINPSEWRRTLREMLTSELAFARKVKAKAKRWKSPRGAPQRTLRDELISELFSKLKEAGATAADARQRVEAILVACQIHAPTGERAVRRAQNRGGDNKSK